MFESLAQYPDDGLEAIDKYESENSLLRFMELGWYELEPSMPFVPNYGVYAICDHLEAVSRGEIKRLLMNVPPGFSKSMSTNVFWPAWEWGPKNKPNYRIINFAHEKGLATRDNVRCRDLIQSEWYQRKWGDRFAWKSDQNAKEYYENSKTGWRQSCSAASLTGKRGDRIIGDDPHSVEASESDTQRETVNRTFSETIPTRVNSPENSAIIIIMQRVHSKDVSSLAIELGYDHLMLPMRFEEERRCYSRVKPSYIETPGLVKTRYNVTKKAWVPVERVAELEKDDDCKDQFGTEIQDRYNVDIRVTEGELLDPVRFPLSAVDDMEKAMSIWGGSYAVAGQMQQRPAPRGGGMFKAEDFKYLDNLNGITGKVVRGWDLAASDKKKSPWSAGAKIMLTLDKRVIICDVNRFRKTPGPMEAELRTTAERDGVGVTQDFPQDPGQAGKSQVGALVKLLHGYDVRSSTESGSKEQRATLLSAQAEGGNVYLLRGEWNDTFINEATIFPNSEFKDQIDAASRAYARLIRGVDSVIALPPQVVEG
ncbi:MAG: phage terminase large subunit [Gammaproteobacteria bacterium]|nr:phage terminase large subunit [Gammaproteobacteria bacterium]